MSTTILSRLTNYQRIALIELDTAGVLEELALRLGASLSGESGSPEKAISAINSELEEMGHRDALIPTNC